MQEASANEYTGVSYVLIFTSFLFLILMLIVDMLNLVGPEATPVYR